MKGLVPLEMGLWTDHSSSWGLLHPEGNAGISIPYEGYVEASLSITNSLHYNEDILLLVIPNNKYRERVSVQIGTLVIN